MVKGLEKILKTTRNILLAGAIGVTSLFSQESNIIPPPLEYTKPLLSQPKLYTETHSKFPREQRKKIEYIFEYLLPELLDIIDEPHNDKYSKICDKIKEKYDEIKLNDPDFPIVFENNFCYIPSENFIKFMNSGYYFYRDKEGTSYGKLDSEEEIIDDSWKDFGKEPETRKVITYYSLPNIKNRATGYIHGADIVESKDGITFIGDDINNTIYIDASKIEEKVNTFIEENIREIKEHDNECNHARPYLNKLKYDLKNSDLKLEHLVLLDFDKIINFEHLSLQREICSDTEYINKMKENITNPNFRENLIEELKRAIFIHEANHFQIPLIYIENKVLKPLDNFVENPDKIIVIKVTPEFNEFIAYLSELANSPNYVRLDQLTDIAIHSYKELNETPHKKAVNALARLYSKKLGFPFRTHPLIITGPAFVFSYLKALNHNEIKNLSKEIYKDVFLSCPTPKEVTKLLGYSKEICLIKEDSCKFDLSY